MSSGETPRRAPACNAPAPSRPYSASSTADAAAPVSATSAQPAGRSAQRPRLLGEEGVIGWRRAGET